MPAHTSWELVVATLKASAASVQRENDEALDRLMDDGSSAVVNAARVSQIRIVMLAVGGFSMLEGILEQTRDWREPFIELDKELRAKGLGSIADEFLVYKMAINVLKHGFGRSYEWLLSRENLPFRVKNRDESFFEEGDIGEIPGLILVDHFFVHSCASVIEKALTALKIPRVEI